MEYTKVGTTMGGVAMRTTAATTTALAALLVLTATAAAAPRSDVILGGSASQVFYHAESAPVRPDGTSRIIGGNIHVVTERGVQGGLAGACDPDPRGEPHARPDDLPLDQNCGWATPAGLGEDFIAFGRHIQNDLPEETGGVAVDTDTSPNGAFAPVGTDTRESFNGRGGLDRGNRLFVDARPVIEDEDMNFRVISTGIDNYLAPQGNPNNRWRRMCGTGRVEAFDNNAAPAQPFFVDQTVKFVIQVWDADLKDPSDQDGGNQDYYIVDLFSSATTFDTASCVAAPGTTPTTPTTPGQPPSTPPAAPAPGQTFEGIPLVQGEQIVAGAARFRGPRRCVNRVFSAVVTGRQIRRVVFTIDGRRYRTVTRPNARRQWLARINPRRFARGVHRVTARVTFVRGAGASRTLRIAFQRCPRAAQRVAPRFTG